MTNTDQERRGMGTTEQIEELQEQLVDAKTESEVDLIRKKLRVLQPQK